MELPARSVCGESADSFQVLPRIVRGKSGEEAARRVGRFRFARLPEKLSPAAGRCCLYCCYLALMVTVNTLFAGLLSVPLKVTEPVAAILPA